MTKYGEEEEKRHMNIGDCRFHLSGIIKNKSTNKGMIYSSRKR
jgi:hypothetical protein